MHHRIMVRKERESKNEIAGFGGLKLPIPAISNAAAAEKQTHAQSLRALFTDDYFCGNVPSRCMGLLKRGYPDVLGMAV